MQSTYNLHTERLSLVPMDLNDLAFFHSTNIDPFVRKYLWDDEEIPIELSRDILTETEKRFQEDGWGLWKMIRKTEGDTIGYVGLWIFFEEEQPQLLFALLPAYTGHGYATEGAQAIIRYAFDELDYAYLIASLDAGHTESARVCERLNMRFVAEKNMDAKPTRFYQVDH